MIKLFTSVFLHPPVDFHSLFASRRPFMSGFSVGLWEESMMSLRLKTMMPGFMGRTQSLESWTSMALRYFRITG